MKLALITGWYVLWAAIVAFTYGEIPTLSNEAPALMYLAFMLAIIAAVSPPYFLGKYNRKESPQNGIIAVGLLVSFSVLAVILTFR